LFFPCLLDYVEALATEPALFGPIARLLYAVFGISSTPPELPWDLHNYRIGAEAAGCGAVSWSA
jgi:hypothetical protein